MLMVHMKKHALAFASLICLVGCGSQESARFSNAASVKRLDGSTISAQEIDSTMDRLLRNGKVPGAGLAILNDRKVVYLKGYGLRNVAKNLPFTPDTVMIAASFTKSTFAYMVMQLVQQHVLDLDKPLYEYLPKPLPEYSNYKDLAGDERYKKITARMCLDHTTGFPNLRRFTEDKKLRINYEPGSRFAYSGEGILLLQMVVETITQKSTEDLMRERVFQPLGMTRTSMTWQPRFENNYADGYDENGNSLGPERRTDQNAAGSMQTTPRDFSLFVQAMMQGTGLNKETREMMLSLQIQIFSKHEFPSLSTETTDENKAIRLSYGLGWGLYWTPYGKAFFKEGHDDGWRNYTVCFDEAGIGIVIMTNSENGEGIYKELLETSQKNTFTPIEWEEFTPYNRQR
jgi:CubicO group peptidase (beta-lactamase class C family)